MVDYEGNLMGPIHDQQGLEQGGISSSDFYKIFGKEQLSSAQKSSLGTPLGNLTISAIGQADDTVLLSNDLIFLSYLLELTKIFCSRYQVELCAEKTKLQAFYPDKPDAALEVQISIDQSVNPIVINGDRIQFVDTAEHVGVVRHISGNGPAILARCSAHQKALAAVLIQGLAKGHRANPAFGLQIHRLYAVPVLLSGLGALILTNKEVDIIELHFRNTLRQILRLFKGTPRSIIYFLAGSLPGTALLHLKQLSLFGMISRKTDNILHSHAVNIFSSLTIAKNSWFFQIRQHCIMYDLPHPSCLLDRQLSKLAFKKLVKSKVINYWECLLRAEIECLRSVPFFKANFMSLCSSHPLFVTAKHSPAQVSRALVQATMLSGRYRCGALSRHWDKTDGSCLLSSQCKGVIEDIPHILRFCPSLAITRSRLQNFTEDYSKTLPGPLRSLLLSLCVPDHSDFCDCWTLPSIIDLHQQFGTYVHEQMYYVTRLWVYALHRERLKQLGLWKLST